MVLLSVLIVVHMANCNHAWTYTRIHPHLHTYVPVGMVVMFFHLVNGPVPFTVLAATLNWYTLSVVRSSAVYLMPRVVFTTVLLLPSSLYSTS